MKRIMNHKFCYLGIWLLAILLFVMSGATEARAGCREDGCYCSGTWSSSWQGTAQNGCIGTDCWYNPNTGNGCRGHVWYLYRTLQEASCTQDGKKEYLCSNCSAYIYKTINATGHDYSAWEKVDERTHKRICANCGDEQIESHTFGSWDIISSHEKNRSCSKCSFVEHWEDYTPPEILSYSIWPSDWTSGTGRVSFGASDAASGISSVELRRTSLIDGSTKVVYETQGNPISEPYNATYTENVEGMYSYSLYVKDLSGNEKLMYLGIIKIDHTSPMLSVSI